MTDTTRVTVGCSARTLRQDHEPHDWQPQPGMDAVHCPGYWIEAPPEPLDAPESDREASTGELAGRSGDSGPQAASSDALRERLVDSLAAYPVACWTPANLADRIMGVVGAELNHWEKTAREQSARAEAAEQRADRLAATLGTALAAMGLHWAHADFHGPQDAYITPEMFKTWRAALEPREQRQEALNRVHRLADLIAAGAPWTSNRDTLARRIRDAASADDGPAATQATDVDPTRVSAALHRSAEQNVSRVIDLYERWSKAGPPIGISMTGYFEWWRAHLTELHDAILPPQEQP